MLFDKSNIFGFPVYTQTFTVEFSSPEEARNAAVRVAPLPFGKKVALTTRWDDSNPRHLKQAETLAKNGWKGTFFLNDLSPDFAEIMKKAISMGMSVGDHGAGHPLFPMHTLNSLFRSVVLHQALIESMTDSVSMSFTFPCTMIDCPMWKDAPELFGDLLVRAGIYSYPDLFGNLPDRFHQKKDVCFDTHIFAANDHAPDETLFRTRFAESLALAEKDPDCPRMTLGIHTWQSDDGFKILDRLYAEYGHRPDIWYCNENEFGAYRWLFYHTTIRKTAVNGSRAEFTVTRAEPAFTGASVPLFLLFSSTAESAVGITFDADGAYGVLPDTEGHGVPCRVDMTESGKESGKFPGISCDIVPLSENRVKVTLRNHSDSDLDRVVFSLVPPPEFACGVLRVAVDSVTRGSVSSVVFELGERGTSELFRRDRVGFQLRTDFACGGRNGRIHTLFHLPYRVDCLDPVPRDQIRVLGPVAAGELKEFGRAFSSPDQCLQNAGRELRLRWRSVLQEGWAPWSFNPLADMPRDAFKNVQCDSFSREEFDAYCSRIQPYFSGPNGEFFCALDFLAGEREDILLDLPFDCMISYFVDGREYKPEQNTMNVHCCAGTHRLILHMRTSSSWSYFANGYFCGLRFADTNEPVPCRAPDISPR